MYARIPRLANVAHVSGSGFCVAEDTTPYLTGAWSEKFKYPPMPFDGVLFGSRMMTAKEAHTSLNVSLPCLAMHAIGRIIIDPVF